MDQNKTFPDDYYVFDEQDAKKTILATKDHIRAAYQLSEHITPKPFNKIIIAGMGGSGIAGSLLQYSCKDHSKIPIHCIKSYEAPNYVDEHTLFIAVSYSGNTEETLSSYKMALRAQAQCVLVSSGGKAQELAKLNNNPHIKLPAGLQPRMAIAYLFFPLLRLLVNAKMIPNQDQEIKELVETLRRQDFDESAIALSEKLFEKTPLIWADNYFYPVAYRWKTQINENAKTPAFCHELSELNHNEILSFTNRNSSFHVVILSTDNYHRRVQKRIELTKDILQKKGVPVTIIAAKGTPLKQLFTAILLGDMTSYYLALRYETDPTPVALIEQFKKDLGPFLI